MLVVLLSCSVPLWGQSARLADLADRIAGTAQDLAEDSYRGFRDRDRGNRADVEALYLVNRFSSSALLFRRMVQDRRPEAELRAAVLILNEELRSSERFSFGRRYWQDMSRLLDEVERELNGRRGPGDRDTDWDRDNRITGRMRWRGKVDNEIHVVVRESTATARTVTGLPATGTSFNFTTSLPRRNIDVQVRRLNGRGSVDVIQQPSRNNNFTAIVRVLDTKGGSAEYEFELAW
jgi:hypothetical protein